MVSTAGHNPNLLRTVERLALMSVAGEMSTGSHAKDRP